MAERKPQYDARRRRTEQQALELSARMADPSAPPIWERLPTETDLQWARFQKYLNTPAPRNLTGFIAENGAATRDVSYMNRWSERVNAYDAFMVNKRAVEEQEEKAARGEAPPNWQARARKVRQSKYALGADMLAIVQERIDLAKGIKRLPDGSTVRVEAEPLKLADKDWPSFARVAAALVAEAIVPNKGAGASRSAGAGTGTEDVYEDEYAEGEYNTPPQLPQELYSVSDAEIRRAIPLVRKHTNVNSGTGGSSIQ